MKTFWNVLGCIAASLLSIVLVVMILVFSVYRSVISFAQPKAITAVVQNVDYAQLLPSDEEMKNIIGVEWVDTTMVQKLVKTKAVTKILDLYAADVVNTVMQKNKAPQLTPDALKSIVETDLDSVVAVIADYLPEDVTITAEELGEEIKKAVNENAQQIIDSITAFLETEEFVPSDDADQETPDFESAEKARMMPENGVKAAQPDIFSIVRTVANPLITVLLLVAILILAGLIYLCRFKRFQGLLWLGIDAAVAALPVALLAVIFSGNLALALIGDTNTAITAILSSVTGVLSRNLTVAAVVCVVLAVAFITAYILLRRTFVKDIDKTAETPAPQVETAD